MPFTAAHPAAILPLLRNSRWFSATGLIAGSVAPDFEYFLLLPLFSTSSHSLEGLLLFNVPVAVVVATIFQLLIRKPMVAHLPDWLQQRALAVPELQWMTYLRTRWITFLFSVIVGAATHLLWDSFTHEAGYFAQKWPVLSYKVSTPWKEMMICRFLQHGSTVAGGLAILLYISRLKTVPVLKNVSTRNKVWFWAIILLAGLGFMAFALTVSPIPVSLRGVVVPLLTGCMLATIMASLSVKLSGLIQRS
jgi:hypothetical protein